MLSKAWEITQLAHCREMLKREGEQEDEDVIMEVVTQRIGMPFCLICKGWQRRIQNLFSMAQTLSEIANINQNPFCGQVRTSFSTVAKSHLCLVSGDSVACDVTSTEHQCVSSQVWGALLVASQHSLLFLPSQNLFNTVQVLPQVLTQLTQGRLTPLLLPKPEMGSPFS